MNYKEIQDNLNKLKEVIDFGNGKLTGTIGKKIEELKRVVEYSESTSLLPLLNQLEKREVCQS
jgi:archaellum component FlaC